ncbi:hypothetical protein G9F71_008340 [Clostridium sp. FP2]|uniref:hypothetical protein n=1 Tax=Clostridium sp. FP2 TaxID=2724481 RepID=UPI0013E8F6DA|nr:hypothetical protein [Clostridium sp. FP2]MBZ9622860.1 hypothetical protein [Clostridium sp. FP2]
MITSKECIICHKTKKASNFYTHRDNKPGYGLNMACKECDKKTAVDITGLKLFCSINNRLFSQDLYEEVSKSIQTKYEHDIEYNSLSEEKREVFLNRKIINMYFSRMGNSQYYQYVPEEGYLTFVEEEAEDNENEENIDSKEINEKKIYSQDWRGSYTKSQIDWLDAYYEDTIGDFVVKTRNHKDYCRKIAKASLSVDEASNEMLNDVPGAEKKYDKATATFDKLSQSAKLSEKTRSTNDVAGLGSLSEIVAQLEQTGFLQKKINFEKDDVDKISEDFRWTITSVGGEF